MNVIIQLLNNKDVSQQVKKKILQLIQHWGLRFEDDSDVLPLFSNVYAALKQRSLPFPSEDEARQQVNKLKDALEGKAPMPESKPLDKKHKKLKKDLEVVIENIVLTNEMIDAHDPDDEVEDNDALVSIVQVVRSFENKIMELIEKIKHDEVMSMALQTNDDLQKTLKRYKRVEHGRVPEKWNPECRKFLPGYKPEPEQPKAEKPKPVARAKPEPVHSAPKAQDDDIFGFSDPSPAPSSSQPPTVNKSQSNANGGDDNDLFGVDFSGSSTAPSQPPPSSDSGVGQLNDIMGKMTLEQNNPPPPQNQFNTGMPGGPGFGGGFGGPAPGMFNTGMPPPGGNFGGGFGGPPPGGNFGGGFGGPPPQNQFNTGMPGGGFGGGFGGGNFGGGSGFNNSDPFSGGSGMSGGSGLFGGPSTNYNPGGGPDAFKAEPKKKKQPGPKEFNDLFSMANKISDRTDQPHNRVDDFVTSYKNNMADQQQPQPTAQVDDMFGGGDQNTGAPVSNQPQQQESDPFGGISDSYGGGAAPQNNDMFGGAQPQQDSSDMFGGSSQPQPQPQQNNDMFGGGQNQNNDMFGGGQPSGGQPSGQNQSEQQKQEELFDLFG